MSNDTAPVAKTDDDLETEATDNLSARVQALADEKAATDSLTDGDIVEARTADTHATEAAEKVPDSDHVKVFVIPGDEARPTSSNYDHDPNIAATRQYVMSQGLRPTGDVVFKGAEPFGPGGKSWALTYAVTAVPAERFDFQAVGVLDQQEETAAEEEANGTTGDDKPSVASNRAAIDAYGASLDPVIDTTGAATKREALALLGITEPTA